VTICNQFRIRRPREVIEQDKTRQRCQSAQDKASMPLKQT